LALPDGAGRFAQGFSGPALLRVPLPRPTASPTGLSPAAAGLPRPFGSPSVPAVAALQPRAVLERPGLGWSAFARRYLRNHCCFLLLGLLRCFSSARSPPARAGSEGLPHSETRGSSPLCGSPRLIAAWRVLRRLSMPRHPPCALRSLAYFRSPRTGPARGACAGPAIDARSFRGARLR